MDRSPFRANTAVYHRVRMVIRATVCGAAVLVMGVGCQSGMSPGMSPTTARRVPAPSTGSYGKASGYYPTTGTAKPGLTVPPTVNPPAGSVPAGAVPGATSGANWSTGVPSQPASYTAGDSATSTSGWSTISANTMLPATPSTMLSPAVHAGTPYPPSYPANPAASVDPSVRYADQDIDRQLNPVR